MEPSLIEDNVVSSADTVFKLLGRLTCALAHHRSIFFQLERSGTFYGTLKGLFLEGINQQKIIFLLPGRRHVTHAIHTLFARGLHTVATSHMIVGH